MILVDQESIRRGGTHVQICHTLDRKAGLRGSKPIGTDMDARHGWTAEEVRATQAET